MSKYLFFLPSLFFFFCQNNDREESVDAPLVQLIAPEQSEIDFNNFIIENQTVNYFTFMPMGV